MQVHLPSHSTGCRPRSAPCRSPNIPGPVLPVQVEFDIFATAPVCHSATYGFTAETLPEVASVTILDLWSGAVGVAGGAA